MKIMYKKIIIIIVILAIITTIIPINEPFSAIAVTAWDGLIATSYQSGTGTSTDPYEIANAAQLARLSNETNSGSEVGNYYFLSNNIDLANIQWTPIGNETYPFIGEFDGNEHTIKNMIIGDNHLSMEITAFDDFPNDFSVYAESIRLLESSTDYFKEAIESDSTSELTQDVLDEIVLSRMKFLDDLFEYAESTLYQRNDITHEFTLSSINTFDYVGLFGYFHTGTIKNIAIKNSNVYGGEFTGSIAGYSGVNALIENCYNSGFVSSDIWGSLGGIVGRSDGFVKNCLNEGIIGGSNCNSMNIGGISGTASRWISDSINTGAVSSTALISNIGGIVGYIDAGGTMISNSLNTGNIGSASSNGYIGGIVGAMLTNGVNLITECANHGMIKGNPYVIGYQGGIAGIANMITFSYNVGSVSGDAAAGVVGLLISQNSSGTMRCYNAGNVTGYSGDAGFVYWTSTLSSISSSFWLVGTASTGVQMNIGFGGPNSVSELNLTNDTWRQTNLPFYYIADNQEINNGYPILDSIDYSSLLNITKTTLVLIPGLMGSRLYIDDNSTDHRVWEPEWYQGLGYFQISMQPFLLSNENGNPHYTLDAERRNNDYGAQDVYKDIFIYLSDPFNFPHSKYDVLFFTYDWRLSSKENAEKLEETLSDNNDVILIAHSMGGLIASSYLAEKQENRDKVKLLVTFGTPYLGSAKTIEGFETGKLLDDIANFVLAPFLKEISANTVSAYELLPTSRYNDYFVYHETQLSQEFLSYDQARYFLSGRPWAQKTAGGTKVMFLNGEAFQESLIENGNHIANTINSIYIIGTGHLSMHIAHYNTCDNGISSLSWYEYDDGDGTVNIKSASNGKAIYADDIANIMGVFRVTGNNSGHTDIVRDPNALEYMKNKILEVSFSAPFFSYSNMLSSEVIENKNSNSLDISNHKSVVIQGLEDLEIYDSNSNQIVQEGRWLYRQTSSSRVRVGEVVPINWENKRFQYVLISDDYIISNIILSPNIPSEITILNYENWLNTSQIRYFNLDNINLLELCITHSEVHLSNLDTQSIVAPSLVAPQETLDSINEARNNR